MVQFSQEYIKEFLRQMYDGEITVENLPPSLYHGIADYLKSGLQKGFGMVDKEGQVVEKGAKVIDTPDIALYEELRENIYMFSAAKTYQEVREISSLLTDGDRVRTRDEFNKIGRETFDKWNTDWARSEYTTAVGQASMALKWNDIEKNKDILPILVFSTNGSGCEECAPYDGFAAPVDDPIWDWLFPLLHFNCMCIVLQQEEGYPITEGEDYDRIAAMKDNVPDVFQMNSGRDKVIFSDEHPYFDIAKKDIDLAKDNFGLPIPPISEELPEGLKFTPAKTVEDAEAWLMKSGVKSVSLKGLKQAEYNAVLKAVEAEASYGPIKIDKIETYRKPNSTAKALYSPSNNSISINLSKLKSETYAPVKSYEVQLAEDKSLLKKFKEEYLGNPKYSQPTVKARINAINNRIWEIEKKIENGETARPWTISSTFEDKAKSLEATVIHELGHYRHFKTIGENVNFSFSKAKSVSEYGRTNPKEYFAEWFCHYRLFGEKEVPKDMLELFKKIK